MYILGSRTSLLPWIDRPQEKLSGEKCNALTYRYWKMLHRALSKNDGKPPQASSRFRPLSWWSWAVFPRRPDLRSQRGHWSRVAFSVHQPRLASDGRFFFHGTRSCFLSIQPTGNSLVELLLSWSILYLTAILHVSSPVGRSRQYAIFFPSQVERKDPRALLE